jgi:hypothetical protein
MVKKTVFMLMIASCAAFAQRANTPASVRQALGSQGAAQPQATAPGRVEMTSSPVSQPVVVNSGNDADNDELHPEARHTGKRDPFVSPISTATGPVLPASNCSSGKHCLVIDQLVLRGVVRTATGMIAVVANSVNKAYFLRENDPVFNGYVVRITGDSVVFKENTIDTLGHRGAREVVKKVSQPSLG